MPAYRRPSVEFPLASSPRGPSLRYQLSQLLRTNDSLVTQNNTLYLDRKQADSEANLLIKKVERLEAENACLKRDNAALLERIADKLREEADRVDRRHRSMSRGRRDRADSPEWESLPPTIRAGPMRKALRAPLSPMRGGRSRRY